MAFVVAPPCLPPSTSRPSPRPDGHLAGDQAPRHQAVARPCSLSPPCCWSCPCRSMRAAVARPSDLHRRPDISSAAAPLCYPVPVALCFSTGALLPSVVAVQDQQVTAAPTCLPLRVQRVLDLPCKLSPSRRVPAAAATSFLHEDEPLLLPPAEFGWPLFKPPRPLRGFHQVRPPLNLGLFALLGYARPFGILQVACHNDFGFDTNVPSSTTVARFRQDKVYRDARRPWMHQVPLRTCTTTIPCRTPSTTTTIDMYPLHRTETPSSSP